VYEDLHNELKKGHFSSNYFKCIEDSILFCKNARLPNLSSSTIEPTLFVPCQKFLNDQNSPQYHDFVAYFYKPSGLEEMISKAKSFQTDTFWTCALGVLQKLAAIK
jgi:hypothetical protein